MGLTNTLMVGHLGGASLAAAGLGAGLYYTLVMVCLGVLTAVAPLAAHAIGADALGAHQLVMNVASSASRYRPGGDGPGGAAARGRGWHAAARETGVYLDLPNPGNHGTAVIAIRLLAIAALFQVFDSQ